MNLLERINAFLIDKGAGRMKELAIVGLVLLLIVAAVMPSRVGSIAMKLQLLAWAAVGGYWIDRTAFKPERRPHMLVGFERTHAEYRRAAIIGCAMLALALAL